MRAELAIWKLVSALRSVPFNYPLDIEGSDGACIPDEATQVNRLIDHPKLKRLFAVKQWLEEMSCLGWPTELDLVEAQPRPVPHFTALQNAQAALDPDAQSRDGVALHPDDESYEAELDKSLFALIRQGQPQEAVELVRRIGQNWKAAIIAGGCYAHDRVLVNELMSQSLDHLGAEDGVEGEEERMSGNFDRLAWKASVNQHCLDAASGDERALYGALCGCPDAVQAISKQLICYYSFFPFAARPGKTDYGLECFASLTSPSNMCVMII